MSDIIKIETTDAPQVIGPYSQGLVVDGARGGLVFCSGQVGVDPKTGNLVEGGIVEQTKQVLENLKAVLVASGSTLALVVKSEVFLKNMNDYKDMNDTYATYFTSDPKPTRTTVEVARLPRDAVVEIGCIALKK